MNERKTSMSRPFSSQKICLLLTQGNEIYGLTRWWPGRTSGRDDLGLFIGTSPVCQTYEFTFVYSNGSKDKRALSGLCSCL
jgi:hypothetical protein